jgi:protoheme IX farnesyltransferase
VPVLRAYIDLMKLRVVELSDHHHSARHGSRPERAARFGLVAATLIGGTLAAGASNAFNMVIESESDKLMARTSKRPLVTGAVSRTQATVFAWADHDHLIVNLSNLYDNSCHITYCA